MPGSRRPHGKENGFQHSCLENSMDRGAWQAQSCGCKVSHTMEGLTKHTHTDLYVFIHKYNLKSAKSVWRKL